MSRPHLGKITDLGFAPDPVEPCYAPGYVCRSPGDLGILLPKLLHPNLLPALLLRAEVPAGRRQSCFSKMPGKRGLTPHAASGRPQESRLCCAACTELLKPPEPSFPRLNLLEPALAFCQASLRWHRLVFNEKIRGLSQTPCCSGTKMRPLRERTVPGYRYPSAFPGLGAARSSAVCCYLGQSSSLRFHRRTPVRISAQFCSKSAGRPRAFLSSQDLQREAAVLHPQPPTRKKEAGDICTSLPLALQSFCLPSPCRADPFILISLLPLLQRFVCAT